MRWGNPYIEECLEEILKSSGQLIIEGDDSRTFIQYDSIYIVAFDISSCAKFYGSHPPEAVNREVEKSIKSNILRQGNTKFTGKVCFECLEDRLPEGTGFICYSGSDYDIVRGNLQSRVTQFCANGGIFFDVIDLDSGDTLLCVNDLGETRLPDVPIAFCIAEQNGKRSALIGKYMLRRASHVHLQIQRSTGGTIAVSKMVRLYDRDTILCQWSKNTIPFLHRSEMEKRVQVISRNQKVVPSPATVAIYHKSLRQKHPAKSLFLLSINEQHSYSLTPNRIIHKEIQPNLGNEAQIYINTLPESALIEVANRSNNRLFIIYSTGEKEVIFTGRRTCLAPEKVQYLKIGNDCFFLQSSGFARRAKPTCFPLQSATSETVDNNFDRELAVQFHYQLQLEGVCFSLARVYGKLSLQIPLSQS